MTLLCFAYFSHAIAIFDYSAHTGLFVRIDAYFQRPITPIFIRI